MIKKIVSIILILIWMGIIFGFSGQDGKTSGSLTEEVIIVVVETFSDINRNSDTMQDILATFTFPLRKCAHFFIYFMLAFLIMNAFYIWGLSKKTILISSIICIIFAITDEIHQLFINGRSGNITDVLLDSSASLISNYLYHRFIIMRNYEKSN